MRKKAPVINCKLPDNEFILDSDSDLRSLGLSPNTISKIADEYDHYPDCKYAVIEHKSKSLKDSVAQLEDTAKQLVGVGKQVDYAIIVAERINRTESMIYKQDKASHRLYNKNNRSFFQIRARSKLIDIFIFYTSQVNRMHKEYGGKIDQWASS